MTVGCLLHKHSLSPSGRHFWQRQLHTTVIYLLLPDSFSVPATDYAEQELERNSYCISRPAATFFLRASGESMNQAGVQNGDLLVVDRAEKPQHGDIVIAEIDGEFTVKRLLLRPRPALEPVSDSPEFRTLYPENICIFGVVTHVIHRTRELR